MILLAIFIFGQIPVTYADTTWPMYGGTLENTHFQKMVGAMEDAPVVKWSYATGDDVEAHGAAVADIDGDGVMEVIIGSHDNKVYCLNGTTGAVKWSYQMGMGIYSAVAVADVDGDGIMEAVFGSMDRKLYCLNGVTGVVEWSYATGDWIWTASPAIADVDGDGAIEIVFGSWDNKVYCLTGATGAVEWSYATGTNVKSSPAIADVDGDAAMEIVFGNLSNKIYCLTGATGTVEWSYTTGDDIESSPAIADVDGDGAMEVVVGSHDKKVYCLTGATGTVKWSYVTGKEIISSPAIADLDDDGVIEIVIGSNDSKVYCLNGVTGGIKWSYNNTTSSIHRGISVADIDGEISGECQLEVLVPNQGYNPLVCLNGEDGSVLWTKELVAGAKDMHDITIADVDNDGCVELVVGTQYPEKIWVLDDVGNLSNCECGPHDVEENEKFKTNNLEFKTMGKGIYLFTPNAMQVDINVYDVSGKLEQAIYKGVLSKGGHTFIPNIKSSGIYFVTLQSRNFKKSLKIIRF